MWRTYALLHPHERELRARVVRESSKKLLLEAAFSCSEYLSVLCCEEALHICTLPKPMRSKCCRNAVANEFSSSSEVILMFSWLVCSLISWVNVDSHTARNRYLHVSAGATFCRDRSHNYLREWCGSQVRASSFSCAVWGILMGSQLHSL